MKRITTTSGLVALSILAISTNMAAKEFSYTYLEGSYLSLTDSSLGPDVDGDGFSIAGSYGFTPNLAVSLLYGETDFDRVFGIKVDATQLEIGITAHTAVGPNTDFFGSLILIDAEVEANDGVTKIRDDDTGNSIVLGLRHMVSKAVELNASISGTDIFNDKSTELELGARYYATKQFSLGAGLATDDEDVDTILLRARYNI